MKNYQICAVLPVLHPKLIETVLKHHITALPDPQLSIEIVLGVILINFSIAAEKKFQY